jgi:A/G-specific adenine glycosylase
MMDRATGPEGRESEIRLARRRLLRWWRANGRNFWWREQRDPYTTAVVEVLLKQTRATSADRHIYSFVQRYPDPQVLCLADLDEIEKAIAPLGFQRQRAEHLQALGWALIENPKALSSDVRSLLTLPGIGPYAAGAISCFAYGRRVPVVDVNVVRILARVWGLHIERGELRKNKELLALAGQFADTTQPRAVNWALLDLGALVCTAHKPRCKICPLTKVCRFSADQPQEARRASSAPTVVTSSPVKPLKSTSR